MSIGLNGTWGRVDGLCYACPKKTPLRKRTPGGWVEWACEEHGGAEEGWKLQCENPCAPKI